MENLVQFLINAAPFLQIISILVLGAMLFSEQKNSKKLKQEDEMTLFLLKQLSEEMRKSQGYSIHLDIDQKGTSYISLAKHDGVKSSKEVIKFRAVFTRNLGIRLIQ